MGCVLAVLAGNFAHVKTFYYRISQDYQRIRQDSSAACGGQDKSQDRKLYLSLADISGYSSTKEWIFPKLVTAAFDPLPALYNFPDPPPDVVCFLSRVSSVSLLHSTSSPYDKPPCFHALGMDDVQEVHLWHIGGAEIVNEDLDQYIGHQDSLTQVYLHLADHFTYTIGEYDGILAGIPGSQPTLLLNGGQQATQIRAQRSLETELYTRDYAEALVTTVLMFAYVPRSFSEDPHKSKRTRYPNLERLVIELESENDNHTALIKRIARNILRSKRRRRVMYGTAEDGKPPIVTDVFIDRRGGKKFVLKGYSDTKELEENGLQDWVEVKGG